MTGLVTNGPAGAHLMSRLAATTILVIPMAIHAALGDVAAAKRALKTYGLRAFWVHRDPTLVKVLADDSDYRRLIAAGS